MESRAIGGTNVSAIGLGCMPMSIDRSRLSGRSSDPGRPDERQSVRTIHAALDAGIRLLDVADVYCLDESDFGHNERLVASALSRWSGHHDDVLVAAKGGQRRRSDDWYRDGRPEYLKEACEASLRRLGVEAIGLYQCHSPDPDVPFADSVGALAELQEEGKVRMVGLCNVGRRQIAEASGLVEVASVQNEYSPDVRTSAGVLEHCADHGIAFLAWGPLGGIGRATSLGSRHRALVDVAQAHGVSPQQVALSWLLALAPVMVPLPGASRPETILDSAGAVDVALSDVEMRLITESP